MLPKMEHKRDFLRKERLDEGDPIVTGSDYLQKMINPKSIYRQHDLQKAVMCDIAELELFIKEVSDTLENKDTQKLLDEISDYARQEDLAKEYQDDIASKARKYNRMKKASPNFMAIVEGMLDGKIHLIKQDHAQIILEQNDFNDKRGNKSLANVILDIAKYREEFNLNDAKFNKN